jgi:hypothetical protein
MAWLVGLASHRMKVEVAAVRSLAFLASLRAEVKSTCDNECS